MNVFINTAITTYRGRFHSIDQTVFSDIDDAIDNYTTIYERMFGEEYPYNNKELSDILYRNDIIRYETETRDGYRTMHLLSIEYVN